MTQAIIIANGRMEKPPEIPSYLQASPLIIAADGGIYNCKSLGIKPNVIIGDLDSIGANEISTYRDAGVEIIRFPTHKNETDLELALRYVMEHKINDVLIFGALGARWDMTVANITLLAHPMFARMKLRMLDGNQELILIRANERSVIKGHPGDSISLIPLTGDVAGIFTDGLEYPLEGEDLKFGSSRGVSNVFIQEQSQIIFREGILLCIINRAG